MKLYKQKEGAVRELDGYAALTSDQAADLAMLELRVTAPQLMFYSDLMDGELEAEAAKKLRGKKSKKRFSRHFSKESEESGGDPAESLNMTDEERAVRGWRTPASAAVPIAAC